MLRVVHSEHRRLAHLSRYGTLLGIINVTVAAFGLIQYPLVSYSTNAGSYDFANWFLLLMAVPFVFVRYYLPNSQIARGGGCRRSYYRAWLAPQRRQQTHCSGQYLRNA